MPRFNFKKQILEKFKTLAWTGITFDVKNESIYIKQKGGNIYLLETTDNERIIYFYTYDRDENKYVPRSDTVSIRFDKDFDITEIISIWDRGYKLVYGWQVKSTLNVSSDIKNIFIRSRYRAKRVDNKKKALLISTAKYVEVLTDVRRIERRAKSYRGSVERYLLNELRFTHTNRTVRDTTSITKGEFEFLVHRLNLRTKRKKLNFTRYLNPNDISSLQDLFSALIKHDVFEPKFLRKLNDYFIKENLKDIVAVGRKILSLGSSNLSTDKAQRVVKLVTGGNIRVKTLEGLWQVYFENYLLFLIFSYRGIYPKVGLKDIEGDKKYPDFIGINHYNGLDVIEIKTHLKRALTYDRSHNNYGFSSELSKSIIQTMNYMDAIVHTRFKNYHDRKKITNTIHKENLNRPRGVIIISSTDKLATNINRADREELIRDFTKLRNSLHNIEILTFDEILDTASNYLENIIGEPEN